MNKRLITTVLLVMLAIGGSLYSNANAQPPRGDDFGRRPERIMRGPEGYLDLMAKVLELSDDQKTQIKTLMEKEHETMGKFRQSMDEGRKAMDDLSMSDEFNVTKAKVLADNQAKKLSEMIMTKAKLQNKIFVVLTPEQRGLAKRIRPLLQPPGMGPMGGGPAGPPCPLPAH